MTEQTLTVTELAQKMDALSGQMQILTEYVDQQRRRPREWDDLKSDLTPVALEAASQLGMSPYPIMMAVSLAASAAFMTPFSHKANLLVMGAGGYRSWHYLKVGTPLTVVLLALLVFLVPVFFPF